MSENEKELVKRLSRVLDLLDDNPEVRFDLHTDLRKLYSRAEKIIDKLEGEIE